MREFLGELYFNQILFSAAAVVVAFFLSALLKRIIDGVFRKDRGRIPRTFLGNLIEVTIFSIAFLTIFSRWGVDITPILTGAGILGLAVSFGAQTLVKDLISGLLIILENQFNVGDYVRIGDHEGEVRKLTLRLTVLKDRKGNLIYIPNSQVTTVVKSA